MISARASATRCCCRRAFLGRKAGHVLPGDFDPARGGHDEAAEHPQERGLAAAGRAEDGEEITILEAQIEGVDSPHAAIVLGQATQPDERGFVHGVRS